MPRPARPGCIASRLSLGPRRSSYEGEVSEAPPNLLRDEEGKHRFGADRPNELRITDVTGFRIPAGKACLSPIVDCFDGMPLSWSYRPRPMPRWRTRPRSARVGGSTKGAIPRRARIEAALSLAGMDSVQDHHRST